MSAVGEGKDEGEPFKFVMVLVMSESIARSREGARPGAKSNTRLIIMLFMEMSPWMTLTFPLRNSSAGRMSDIFIIKTIKILTVDEIEKYGNKLHLGTKGRDMIADDSHDDASPMPFSRFVGQKATDGVSRADAFLPRNK